jgi:hypothetical protein
MAKVANTKSAAPTRKSLPNVKPLQTLLKSMEREVAKLGKELEKLQQRAAQELTPKQSKKRGAVSAKTTSKKTKKVAAPRKARSRSTSNELSPPWR